MVNITRGKWYNPRIIGDVLRFSLNWPKYHSLRKRGRTLEIIVKLPHAANSKNPSDTEEIEVNVSDYDRIVFYTPRLRENY